MRILLALSAICVVFGQAATTQVAFEVASVKPSPPLQPGQFRGTRNTPNGINFQGATLRYCIGYAYHVQGYQISGPRWLGDLRYEIVAKIPPSGSVKQIPEMLQTLLAQRFMLRIHRESKEFPGYALVVGKNGLKLSKPVEHHVGARPPIPESAPSQPIIMTSPGRGGGLHVVAEQATMASLAEHVSHMLGLPVVDLTNTPGSYDFVLDASQEDTRNGNAMVVTGEPGRDSTKEESPSNVSIFSSIQNFGLKLVRHKAPLDIIVVDHAEKTPTAN